MLSIPVMFQESRFYEMGEWQGIPRLMSSGVTEEWKAPKNMVGWCDCIFEFCYFMR